MKLQDTKPGRKIFLKQCPRCNGDVSANSDHYGSYWHCLQCGYMADIKDPRAVEMLRSRLTGTRVA